MEVRVAKTAGFCFGVKRAVDRVYQLAEEADQPICTLGPVIHNETVVEDLEKKGVRVLSGCEELEQVKDGIVVIRSHGVGKSVYEKIAAKGLKCVDVTCPFVLKIHRIVEKESSQGRDILICGDGSHPEVKGICGWCRQGANVVSDRAGLEDFMGRSHEKICVVAQTTFNYNKFKDLVEILAKKSYDSIILNTICDATEKRQREAQAIAGGADVMLVIGGRQSSNTQKLYEICKEECKNTYYIQTLVDLDSEMFRSSSCVGITAGASTPNKIIEEVHKHVRNHVRTEL
ncbi:MAG: 4-hydroxy-3-methylbut-2-enyl diphosphate reductase [Lachnospiraceae bacterium]|nr:4-hydroxy-3-methylbut-2-enyl diphosphate reductase [Lachnospiraceae bacterium]MCI9389078.1 4-hydroxy-3-methylbut-2-enyl diphosphate reductase [Lachnospiraceae bacterium]